MITETDWIVHWDLDGRCQSVVLMKLAGILRRSTCVCKSSKTQQTNYLVVAIELKLLYFRTIKSFKIFLWGNVAASHKKNVSTTKKHNTNTYETLWQNKSITFSIEKQKETSEKLAIVFQNKFVDWDFADGNLKLLWRKRSMETTTKQNKNQFLVVWPMKPRWQGTNCIAWQST